MSDIIFQYTRAQAIEDGVQFDVSDDKGSDVYKTAVFVTTGLHAALGRGQGKDADTYSARLWDVCFLVANGRRYGRTATRASSTLSDTTRYASVKIGARRLTIRGECGPVDIDDPRPAITLGLPEEF